MAVAVDVVTTSSATLFSSPYTHSFTHTPGSADTYLVVAVASTPTASVNSVTWRGLTGLTKRRDVLSTNVRLTLWTLLSKAGGTSGSVLITMSGQSRIVAAAATFDGVDFNNPVVDTSAATGNGTSVTGSAVDVPAGGLAYDGLAVDGGNATVTAGGGQSQQWNAKTGNLPSQSVRGAGSTESGPGSVSASWTISATVPASRNWAHAALALNPVAQGGGLLTLMGAGE